MARRRSSREGLVPGVPDLPAQGAFAGFDSRLLQLLTSVSQQRIVVPGEVLVSSGGRDDALFILARGDFEVVACDDLGAEIFRRTISGPSYVGEICALGTRKMRTTTVTATTVSDVRVLSGQAFRVLLKRFPQDQSRFMAQATQRLEALTRAEDMNRLAQSRLAESDGGSPSKKLSRMLSRTGSSRSLSGNRNLSRSRTTTFAGTPFAGGGVRCSVDASTGIPSLCPSSQVSRRASEQSDFSADPILATSESIFAASKRSGSPPTSGTNSPVERNSVERTPHSHKQGSRRGGATQRGGSSGRRGRDNGWHQLRDHIRVNAPPVLPDSSRLRCRRIVGEGSATASSARSSSTERSRDSPRQGDMGSYVYHGKACSASDCEHKARPAQPPPAQLIAPPPPSLSLSPRYTPRTNRESKGNSLLMGPLGMAKRKQVRHGQSPGELSPAMLSPQHPSTCSGTSTSAVASASPTVSSVVSSQRSSIQLSINGSSRRSSADALGSHGSRRSSAGSVSAVSCDPRDAAPDADIIKAAAAAVAATAAAKRQVGHYEADGAWASNTLTTLALPSLIRGNSAPPAPQSSSSRPSSATANATIVVTSRSPRRGPRTLAPLQCNSSCGKSHGSMHSGSASGASKRAPQLRSMQPLWPEGADSDGSADWRCDRCGLANNSEKSRCQQLYCSGEKPPIATRAASGGEHSSPCSCQKRERGWQISLCQHVAMRCHPALPSKDVFAQRKAPRPVSPEGVPKTSPPVPPASEQSPAAPNAWSAARGPADGLGASSSAALSAGLDASTSCSHLVQALPPTMAHASLSPSGDHMDTLLLGIVPGARRRSESVSVAGSDDGGSAALGEESRRVVALRIACAQLEAIPSTLSGGVAQAPPD